jgi:hypothetical protein
MLSFAYIMARIHDELDKVVKVFTMRKGLEDMGPKEGKPDNQHERFLGIKVGEGGDSSDRQTESRLLPGGRIVDDRVPVSTYIAHASRQFGGISAPGDPR